MTPERAIEVIKDAIRFRPPGTETAEAVEILEAMVTGKERQTAEPATPPARRRPARRRR